MKFYLILMLILMMGISCAKKPGTTSSKIKIISGNFQALLANQANNGLVLFGKSDSGKSFTKNITGDTVDIVFPNGTWNFYAIAWEHATPNHSSPMAETGLQGTVSCAKNIGVQLTGADASLTFNLSNANCSDTIFHPNVKMVSALNRFPNVAIQSCQDLGSITASGDLCTGNSPYKKGYATYIRLVIPESKQFNEANDGVYGPAIMSKCIEIDKDVAGGYVTSPDNSTLNNINLPQTGVNGLALSVRTYFSETDCIDSFGFNTALKREGQISTKLKIFTQVNSPSIPDQEKIFVASNEADVCQPIRSGAAEFATGRGTQFHPYGICSKAQLDLLTARFATTNPSASGGFVYNSRSFDLLTNINFNFQEFVSIGQPASSYSYPSMKFTGVFNGNNHRIENLIINCLNQTASLASGFGLFRASDGATFKDLTLNKIALDCEEKDGVGSLVGWGLNTTFSGIKVFGHVSGQDDVGGLVGGFDGVSGGSLTDIHVQAGVEGRMRVGGFLGGGINFASSANKVMITQSSFKGDTRSRLHGNYKGSQPGTSACPSTAGLVWGDYYSITSTGTGCNAIPVVSGEIIFYDLDALAWRKSKSNEIIFPSYVGGIAGKIQSGANGIITQTKVDLESVEGSTFIGGMIGYSINVEVNNSYITGIIKSYSNTDNVSTGNMNLGGISGHVDIGNFHHNIIYAQKVFSKDPADTTAGGIIGGEQNSPTCANNLYLGSAGGPTCNTSQNTTLSGITTLTNYSSNSFDLATTPIWSFPASDQGYDIPRLEWEAGREAAVPYLKRECSGNFSTQAGAGTDASPKLICTWNQFGNMVPGATRYALKRDLYHDGTVLSTIAGYPSDGMMPVGEYHLDGDNHSLINYFMSPNFTFNEQGLFKRLGLNSVVKNLKIKNAKIATSGATIAGSSFSNIGLLAGNNLGLINNLDIQDSEVLIDGATLTGDKIIRIGSVTGQNTNGATLINSKVDAKISILKIRNTNVGGFILGGLVAENAGNISLIRDNTEVIRKMGDIQGSNINISTPTGCSPSDAGKYVINDFDNSYWHCNGSSYSPITPMKSSEVVGGSVGIMNSPGVLDQIRYQGNVFVTDIIANTNGVTSPMVGTLVPGTSLTNIEYEGGFKSMKADSNTMIASITGAPTISKIIFKPHSIIGINTSVSMIPTQASQTLCLDSTAIGCYNEANFSTEFNSATSELTFKNSGTAISGLNYMTNWNLGISEFRDLTKTWTLDDYTVSGSSYTSTETPSLMRLEGDFEELGAGF